MMNLLLVTSSEFVQEDRNFLQAPGANVRVAVSGAAASDLVSRHDFDALFICSPQEDCSCEAIFEEMSRLAPNTPIIVRNRFGSIAQAMNLLKAGAVHYFGPDTIGATQESAEVQRLLRTLRSKPDPHTTDEAWMKILVGTSPAMKNVAQVIKLVASRRCNVLITGETGTGKEMAARAIHAASSRCGQRLVAVNCSALPENLLEAELFGHTKGAFTGAQALRIGRFEEAHKSTLFLDEIADLPLGVQTKLLRTLQEREVQRLGSSESIKVDFRLIAACNVNLEERMQGGEFREDLFYRLSTVPLRMPALRERREDIPLLVRHFVKKVCNQEGIPARKVNDETLDRLSTQNWPGNVRQLENAVEMAIALSGDRETLQTHDFKLVAPAQFRNVTAITASSPTAPQTLGLGSAADTQTISLTDGGLDYERVVGDFERAILKQALELTKGNKKAAADILCLKRTTLNAKLKSLEAVAS